jgi:histidyl-tRNA synthetase
MQFDADTVGSASPAADAENCMMAADTMEVLGVARGSYVVKVNNRKVLDGLLEALGVGGEQNIGKRLAVLRAIDKLDRLGVVGVADLLGEGRKDESGDYTKGAGLDRSQIDNVLQFLGYSHNADRGRAGYQLDPLLSLGGRSNEETLRWFSERVKLGPTGVAGVAELKAIANLVAAAGYEGRIVIDPTIVRGLEYYTGAVYEVDLTTELRDADGRTVRFGAVASGGRYDGLVSRFRGEAVPATGVSIGVSRLLAALQLTGKIDSKPAPGPVVVTVFEQDRVADYQRMVQELRNANIRAELYLGAGKFGAQMKYADKRAAPCVVIQGGDEKAKGEVQIKDLTLGAELAGMSKDRDEYKQKQAEAQFAIKESELVAGVRRVLDRHKVRWE